MTKQLAEMESLFKALADATRLRILGLLLTGEVCVCDIHESLKIPQPKASRHLAYLRRAGLVETRRDGLWIHYRLGTAGRSGARRDRRRRPPRAHAHRHRAPRRRASAEADRLLRAGSRRCAGPVVLCAAESRAAISLRASSGMPVTTAEVIRARVGDDHAIGFAILAHAEHSDGLAVPCRRCATTLPRLSPRPSPIATA